MDHEQPVLQLLDVKQMGEDEKTPQQWVAKVSDGVLSGPALLARRVGTLAARNALTSHSCIKLLDFGVEEIEGAKTIVIKAVELVGGPLMKRIVTPAETSAPAECEGLVPVIAEQGAAAGQETTQQGMRPIWRLEPDFPQLLSHHLPLHRTLAALLQVALQRHDDSTLALLNLSVEQASEHARTRLLSRYQLPESLARWLPFVWLAECAARRAPAAFAAFATPIAAPLVVRQRA